MKSRILVILSVLSLLLVGSAATSAKAANSSVTVSVPAIKPWADTGVFVHIGDLVSITATGIVYTGATDPGTTPAGLPGCVATADDSRKPGPFLGPGLTCYSLIGRVGNGSAFEVGAGTFFVALSSGELNLSVDDNYFPDNRGAWTATITR